MEASLSLRRVNEEKATATKMGGMSERGSISWMRGGIVLQSARCLKDGLYPGKVLKKDAFLTVF